MIFTSLIREEPEFCFKFILNKHILLKFLVNIHLKIVKDLLLGIFDPIDTTLNIPRKLRQKIYFYAK